MSDFYDFTYDENFLSEEEANALFENLRHGSDAIEYVEKSKLLFRIYGKELTLPRDKGFYGDQIEMNIDGNVVKATPLYRYGGDYYPPILPWTDSLKKIRDMIYEKTGTYCNHVVVNRYKSGENYIGYHSDKTKDFNPEAGVLTVSLGQTRTLDVQEKKAVSGEKSRKVSIDLKHGSLFVLGHVTNEKAKHRIRKETKKMLGERISLTFRSIRTVRAEDGIIYDYPHYKGTPSKMKSGSTVSKKRKLDDL